MLGVLKVILRRDRVAPPCFVARQLEVAFVAPLRVLGHLLILMTRAARLLCA